MTYRLFVREPKDISWADQFPKQWEELDLGDEVPAMVYQINNLDKLEDRQALYSQNIKLPKSNRNCMALGFIDDFSVVAEAAYTPREVLLTCDDMRLTPGGALLNINTISRYIECNIVSATLDLFKTLDTPIDPMVDWDQYTLSLQELNRGYIAMLPIPVDNPEISIKRRWPLIFPYKGAIPQTLPGTIDFWGIVPCVQFLDFVRFAFRRQGYRLVSDLIGDAEVEKDYIMAATMPKSDIHNVSGRWYGRISIPVSSTGNLYVNPAYYGSDTLELSTPTDTTAGNSDMRFTAPNPGEYTVTLKVDNSNDETDLSTILKAIISISNADGTNRTYLLGDPVNDAPVKTPGDKDYKYEFSEQITLIPGEIVRCYVNSQRSALPQRTPLVDFSVTMNEEQECVSVGQNGYLMRDTGFKSYKEALQAFIRSYGVMVEVKRYARPEESDMYRMPDIIGEVWMYSFNEIYRRKDAGIFYDWSDKVAINEDDEQFMFAVGDYAQNNTIEFTENSDDGVTDSGSFQIANKTLQSEKTLFSIPIEAGTDISGIASIPILAGSEESLPDDKTRTVWNYEGSKPHLVRIDGATWRNITIKQGRTESERGILVARHRPASYLIDNHYAALARMLKNAKKIRWKFYLDVTDLENFDHITPVYIEYFGAFFYVQKIENYIEGRLTTCELVRL